ncbi:hypothetical protein PG993_012762 [Apiospora rasikravindrae]|uniref:Uncharacterized protein n=1 Tax=Apiospora rasikravindrae TaxID=990691 RepID=A0ABR1RWZ8_9PEZI
MDNTFVPSQLQLRLQPQVGESYRDKGWIAVPVVAVVAFCVFVAVCLWAKYRQNKAPNPQSQASQPVGVSLKNKLVSYPSVIFKKIMAYVKPQSQEQYKLQPMGANAGQNQATTNNGGASSSPEHHNTTGTLQPQTETAEGTLGQGSSAGHPQQDPEQPLDLEAGSGLSTFHQEMRS